MSCKISGILVRHTSFLKRKIILTFLRWHVLCTVHYRQSMVQSMHKNSLFTSVSQCCTNSGEWSLCWSTIHWLWQQWVASSKQVFLSHQLFVFLNSLLFLLICLYYSHRCMLYSFAVLLCTNNCCRKWLLNARTCWDGYFTLLYLPEQSFQPCPSYFLLCTSFFNWIGEVFTLGSRSAVRCFGVGHWPKLWEKIGDQYKDLTGTVFCALKVSCTEWRKH